MKVKAINVHLPGEIHKRLRRAADIERRSLRQQIIVFLQQAAERYEEEHGVGELQKQEVGGER